MPRLLVMIAAAWCTAACGRGPAERVLTLSASGVGREASVVRAQLARFQQAHPQLRVVLRPTPDAADQRHQLYVQWLNAHAPDPDVVQLDVVWTPEFAAAGWIARLDRFAPPAAQFFPAALAADRWNGALYGLPWFIDVGMLYWRTDLMPHAPASLAELATFAAAAQRAKRVPYGFVWQGARYEGLVTVFLECLGAFGGAILDDHGRVVLDGDAAVRALTWMRDAIYVDGIAPPAVLTWQEEQVRFAFQNGDAAFMRNWPYAFSLLEDPAQSSVAGRFAVAAMPAAPGGGPTAALGGAGLAVNAFSDQPDDAYALIDYLLQPAQMLERAREAGQFPSRRDLYASDDGPLAGVLPVRPSDIRRIIEHAVPRPVTPVYTELSELLQVALHRALTRQQAPADALRGAAASMRALLDRAGLAPAER